MTVAQARWPAAALVQLYSISLKIPFIPSGDAVKKFTLSLAFAFFLPLFLAGSPQASPHSPSTPAAPAQPGATVTSSSPASSTAPSHTQTKITVYSLPPDLYRKAHNRSRIGFASRIIGFFYGLFVIWFILRHKFSARFRDWAERVSSNRFAQALFFTPLLVITIGVLEIPLGIFDEWILKLYRISVQPWPSWFADWAKAQLLAMIIGSFLVWLLYAVIRKSSSRWWFYFWILSLPIILFLVFISPYVIEPMFDKFEPLSAKAPQLIAPLQRVTRRAGQEVSPERMFWMKASDKTIATNAYVSGFGASKRIVIWDTTIAQETPDEVVGDFGHEMGHYALGHIWKGFAFLAALLFVLLYLGYRTIGWLLARYGARWEVRGLEDWASLPALLLLLSVFSFVSNAFSSGFSRYQENQADVYGLEVTHGVIPDPGQACAQSFQNYGEKALVDPDPNPIQVFLFYDHPPVTDRIDLCVTYDAWSKGQSPQFVH
jgi:STE24 endopeptidase